MCGTREVIINEQSSLKQQQLIDLDISVKQHHKHIQSKKDKKEEKENKTQILFT